MNYQRFTARSIEGTDAKSGFVHQIQWSMEQGRSMDEVRIQRIKSFFA
jgi:hypothetical protein